MSSSKLSESKQSETDSIDISKISKSDKSSSLSKSKSKTKSEKNEDSKINTISKNHTRRITPQAIFAPESPAGWVWKSS